MKKETITLLLICVAAFAQQKGSFTDTRDKKTYKTVKIGKQTWMAQNLDYHGEDGNLGSCYNNEPENCKKYGRLYDWVTAMNIDTKFEREKLDSSDVKHQGVCPEGWHLPSKEEWQTLVDFAGGNDVSGKKLKAKSGWNGKCKKGEENIRSDRMKVINNTNNCGTDNYGFSALPGGTINSVVSIFAGDEGYWWSSSDDNDGRAYFRYMHYNNDNEERNRHGIYYKGNQSSVRCIKD